MKNLKEVIREAEAKKVAIGHFNISNLETLKAIAHAAMKLNVPVIIGVSEGERGYLGVHHVRDLINSYNTEHGKEKGFWLFLNADHTHTIDKIKEAVEAEFDEVLFDGGKLPLEENIKNTRKAVLLARSINKDIVVEGELGYIGSSSEVRSELPEGAAIKEEDLTRPEDAARFVSETGVDLLAPAVGNIHGMFRNAPDPKLDIERIRNIKKSAGVPLVLHGGSGNRDEEFLDAIDAGVVIIHISTELRVAWRKGMETSLSDKRDEVAPYKLTEESLKEMESVVEHKLRLFNKLN